MRIYLFVPLSGKSKPRNEGCQDMERIYQKSPEGFFWPNFMLFCGFRRKISLFSMLIPVISISYHSNFGCSDKIFSLALSYHNLFIILLFMTIRSQDRPQKSNQVASENNGLVISHFKSVVTKYDFSRS